MARMDDLFFSDLLYCVFCVNYYQLKCSFNVELINYRVIAWYYFVKCVLCTGRSECRLQSVDLYKLNRFSKDKVS